MIKLTGSKTEQDYREILTKTHKSLFQEDSYKYLLNVLYSNFDNMMTAYFIGHIHEQGYDLYTLLINVNIIAKIEIEEYLNDRKSSVEIISINEYKKNLNKKQLIKLTVAIDLAKKDLGKWLISEKMNINGELIVLLKYMRWIKN